jgi:hypothetical protein
MVQELRKVVDGANATLVTTHQAAHPVERRLSAAHPEKLAAAAGKKQAHIPLTAGVTTKTADVKQSPKVLKPEEVIPLDDDKNFKGF